MNELHALVDEFKTIAVDSLSVARHELDPDIKAEMKIEASVYKDVAKRIEAAIAKMNSHAYIEAVAYYLTGGADNGRYDCPHPSFDGFLEGLENVFSGKFLKVASNE